MAEFTERHLADLHAALRAEEAAEREEHARLDRLSEEDQVANGHAWPPVRVTELEPKGPRVRLGVRAPRGVLLHDGIGPGDPVWVDDLPATVEWVDGTSAELTVHRDLDSERPQVRIRSRHDSATFVRYRKALERADGHRSPLKQALLTLEVAPVPPEHLALPGLDRAQQRAAAVAVRALSLSVIWGPPGTGKTWVLGKVLRRIVDDGLRAYALADSNAAVDHLALRAAAEGLQVVRVGPVARVGEALADLHLHAAIERSTLGPTLKALDRDLVRHWGTALGNRLRHERNALAQQARELVLGNAEVIATTFGSLAAQGAELPERPFAVVDEATQAHEAALWAAVPLVERMVLAGDPKQLGPVSKVPGSLLARSFLERWGQRGQELPMLEVQHRMAPALRSLVSPVYGAAYTDGPGVLGQRPVWGEPVTWVDTAGASEERRDDVTQSLYEPLEVRLASIAVARLREAGLDARDLAVIAPYSAQVARLRSAMPDVEVSTVNAFQGREKEAVVATFVRSNAARELGFVADERRLNVTLTRARRQLILIGDVGTLTVHPRFAALADALGERVVSVWEEPWSEALAT